MSQSGCRPALLLFALTGLLNACIGSSADSMNGVQARDGTDDPNMDKLKPTIESIQKHIFTPRCTSCHAGSNAPNGLRLDDAQTSYDNLVNVDTMEYPLLKRVKPDDPDNSYLIHKLEGTQEVGAQMPKGQNPLSHDEIAVIRDWITQGAPPPKSNSGTSSVFLPPVELGSLP